MSNRAVARPDPIQAALRSERKRQGLSQAELGQRIGRATYQTVYQWECVNEPTLSNLRVWAAALGFDLALVPIDQPGGDTRA